MGDGKLRMPVESEIVRGTVLRMVNEDGTAAPFADCLVSDVYLDDAGERQVTLVRPYVRADSVTHGWSAGFERFDVRLSRVLKNGSLFRLVLSDRERPMLYLCG